MTEHAHGIDLDAVAAWMDEQDDIPKGPIEDVSPVGGGTQNLMLRFRRGGRELILRRGPKHLRPKTNDNLRREITALTALRDTDVRCPRIVAACPDETRIPGGAVLYLMEPVDGFNASVELPDAYAENESWRHEMGLDVVDALTTLANVDHLAVGLGDFGKPEGFLERQAPRWLSELEGYSSNDGYDGPDLPGVDDVAGWLSANVPPAFTPGIVHGDYHMANLMFRRDEPRLAAIVDWEMCTIGDPLLDLGWLMALWPNGGKAGGAATGAALSGLPTTDELVERYAANSTRDLTHVPWYTVAACFKLGIILEGTHARACAGKADKNVGDMLHAIAVGLFNGAHEVMATA